MAKEQPQVANKQDEIVVIKDIVKAVRQTPDVYIGVLGNIGFLSMIREIVQNSCDEIAKGNSIDKTVIVSYDERTRNVIVEDFGQGIPLDLLEVVFSTLHSSSNYNKQDGSGRYSSGKNGKFINAAYRGDLVLNNLLNCWEDLIFG